MKTFSQAAAFLSLISTSSSLLVPPATPAITSSPDIQSVAGSTDHDGAQIHFAAPCPSCVIGTDDGLRLDLEIASADSECTGTNIRLNGRTLEPSAQYQIPRGSLWIETKLSNGLGLRSMHADWEVTCILGQASLVSFKFFENDDTANATPLAGFTTSFRQTDHPEFLRLQARPNAHINSQDNLYDWLYPTHGPIELHSSINAQSQSSLLVQHELHELAQLQAKEDVIKQQINELKSKIDSKWRTERSNCRSIFCKAQSVVGQLPVLGKLVAESFSHEHHSHKKTPDVNASGPAQTTTAPLPETSESNLHQSIGIPPTLPLMLSKQSEPGPPHHHNKPGKHFPPQMNFPGFRPPHPWSRPPNTLGKHPHPPCHHHQHHRPGHIGPLSLTSHQQLRVTLFVAVGGFVTLIALALLVFACIRRRCIRLRDPRRRVECAARREEKRRRHLYRKAACKYRWKTLIDRCRRTVTSDPEEKQGIASEKPNADGTVMHHEIDNLRAAHKFVDDMIKAEEGDAGYERGEPSSAHQRPHAAELDAADRCSLRSEDGLPAYSLPPSYGHGMDGDISVVDGFTGYTPSQTDETPESSVVDCSPRPSFETQRTMFTSS